MFWLPSLRVSRFAVSLIVGGLALFSAPVAALAGPSSDSIRCLRWREPNVRVNLIYTDVDYHNELPVRAIRKLAEDDQAALLKDHRHLPVGLSTAEMIMETDYKISAVSRPNGGSCAQITELNVGIGFRNNNVYVAREFDKRSCAYKEILKHEEKHVATDKQVLFDMKDFIEDYVVQAVRKVGFVRTESAGTISQEIDARLNDTLAGLSSQISEERQRRQMKIDSPDEYRQVSYSCNGELQRTLDDRLGANWKTTPR